MTASGQHRKPCFLREVMPAKQKYLRIFQISGTDGHVVIIVTLTHSPRLEVFTLGLLKVQVLVQVVFKIDDFFRPGR